MNRQKEIQKCKENIGYFVENYLWVDKPTLSLSEKLVLLCWFKNNEVSVIGKPWMKIYMRRMYYRHRNFIKNK